MSFKLIDYLINEFTPLLLREIEKADKQYYEMWNLRQVWRIHIIRTKTIICAEGKENEEP